MPLVPPLVLEARNGTKFQLFPQFSTTWTHFGSNKELGGVSQVMAKRKVGSKIASLILN
jgi:hypothetical protein